jgi:hypothetical protein
VIAAPLGGACRCPERTVGDPSLKRSRVEAIACRRGHRRLPFPASGYPSVRLPGTRPSGFGKNVSGRSTAHGGSGDGRPFVAGEFPLCAQPIPVSEYRVK